MFCKYLGHRWRFNFPTLPNKRICKRCKEKQQLVLKTLEWSDKFTDSRTDDELIKKWFN